MILHPRNNRYNSPVFFAPGQLQSSRFFANEITNIVSFEASANFVLTSSAVLKKVIDLNTTANFTFSGNASIKKTINLISSAGFTLTSTAILKVFGANDVLFNASATFVLTPAAKLRVAPFAPIDELEDLDLETPWSDEDLDKHGFLVKNFDRIREAFTERPSGKFETVDGKIIVIKNGVVTEIYDK